MTEASSVPKKRTFFGTLIAIVFGALFAVYLLNLSAGFDLIPDIVPVLGNLDEAAAMALLLACLSYLGLELPWLQRVRKQRISNDSQNPQAP